MYAAMRRVRYFALVILTALFLVAPNLAGVSAVSVTYEHDLQGRVKKATYSDGTIVDYSYDANGNRTAAIVTPAPVDTTPPTIPGTPVISNVQANTATATWTAATDNVAVAGYDYRLNAGTWTSIGNVLTFNVPNLVSATNYTFSVRARDAAVNTGPVATSLPFTTLDNVAPSVPQNVTATSTVSTTVNVSWTASTDNVAVTGYKVFRGGSQIGTSPTNSYADNTTVGSTSYSYKVSAYDAVPNNSAQSTAANVTTPDTIAPSIPSGLTATTISSTRINLAWNVSTDTGGSGLAGYRIYRNGLQINTSATNSFADTTLSPATVYTYKVAAYDNAPIPNQSAQSAQAQATTLAALSASVSSITWNYIKRGSNPPNIDPDDVCSGSGGAPGYTYLWQYVSGDTSTSLVTAPSNPSAKWTHPVPNFNTDYISVWRCRVTDTASAQAFSANVTVKFRKVM
jgi:YD repeat-containing protein